MIFVWVFFGLTLTAMLIAFIFAMRQIMKRRQIVDEFGDILLLFQEGCKSSTIASRLLEKSHLRKIDGFGSVMTLLEYRHRGRAWRRFSKMFDQWNNKTK